MDANTLLSLCSKFILLPWLLLLVLPNWKWTKKLIFHAWIPMLLGIAYIVAFTHGYPFPEGGGFGSLSELLVLFSSPWMVVAGWIHYLAFDLFIGAWEVRDAQRHRINHLFIVPCLILTFLAGPVGLLLYFLIRGISKKTLTTIENS